jgi:hypothetical protein
MKARSAYRHPRTHIVRVYRQSAHTIVGHVEEVRTGLVRPFRTPAELWRAIRGTTPAQQGKPSQRIRSALR